MVKASTMILHKKYFYNFLLYIHILFQQARKTISLLRGVNKNHEIVQTELDLLRKEEAKFKSLPDISLAAIGMSVIFNKLIFIYIITINMNVLQCLDSPCCPALKF